MTCSQTSSSPLHSFRFDATASGSIPCEIQKSRSFEAFQGLKAEHFGKPSECLIEINIEFGGTHSRALNRSVASADFASHALASRNSRRILSLFALVRERSIFTT